jgi:hypothetical protein
MKEQEHEGCNMHGTLHVNKVAGNFHFAPGHSYAQNNMHIHEVNPEKLKNIRFSHEIHELSFGDGVNFKNPLDGVKKQASTGILLLFN